MATWTFSCINHPHLRWTKNKCGPGFIGRGVLIFEGDAQTGKPGDLFGTMEGALAEWEPEARDHFLKKYVPQCDCHYRDLYVVAEEYLAFKEGEPFQQPLICPACTETGRDRDSRHIVGCANAPQAPAVPEATLLYSERTLHTL